MPVHEFRMYHTGDIVRYRQDGNVEFVGRKDGQVKIRGFRIETKEIEAVIRSFEGIKDATVQAYDYESGGKYLAAFVVSDETVDTEKLREYLKSQKPAYMIPAVIMQIDKVPLTVNHKVDKKALPKPELQRREYVAPSGKAEEDFCGIFGEILGLERVGAEDDFFELGGSSVIAMKVVIAAGKKGYSIVYNDVFKYTTPRLLAEFATGNKYEENTHGVSPSAGKISEVDPEGYDYSAINALLAQNTLEAFRSGERQDLGDVLLAGATGYLGIHVLREILTSQHSTKVFCLVRAKDGLSGEKRLKTLLEYYFGNDHAEYFAERITVIEGDATNTDSLKNFVPDSAMTVINCAASAKHFAKGNEIERTNVDSVKNLAAWCEANNSRLVHISTVSIIGGRKNGLPPEGYRFDEHVLFAGQTVNHNKYVHSKFLAERFIYEEILTHGLNAKVLRVGDLAPRLSDGKIQVNFRTNNIMNTLRAYKILGVVPFSSLAEEMEFSPIDCLAKAVIALAGTPKECVYFIPITHHRALMQDNFTEIRGLGYEVRTTEDDELKQALDAALSDSRKNSAVSSLAAYANNSGIQELGYESLNTGFTSQILYRLGFSWSETGSEYIRLFVRKLDGLSFFDEKRNNMKLIHEIVSEYAVNNPSKEAAEDSSGGLSYGELDGRSNRGAKILQALGVSAGDSVGVYVPYVKDVLIGALSVWKAGGVYVPMDDAYPAERLEYILKDSDAKAILTRRSLWENKPLNFPLDRVIFMDEPSDSTSAFTPCTELTPKSPAMILYTSGTTGRPKGVLHRHEFLTHIVDWLNTGEGFDMSEDSHVGLISRFNFVATITFMFGALLNVGTLCFAPEPARNDLEQLYHFLTDKNITHIFIASGIAAILAEDYDISGVNVFAAGEKLPNFRAHSDSVYLRNMYGSTEIGLITSEKIHGSEKPITIGPPGSDTKAMLVDESLSPSNPGEVGELLIANEYMSMQYLHLPEQTAEKWIQLDGLTWYRTGDRAILTTEGSYCILGRTDNMIKLRGFRIETGEVESQVSEAVAGLARSDVKNIVVCLQTVSRTDYLVCYYESEQELAHDEVRAVKEQAAKSLADYMIPDVFMRVEHMPRNLNGKIIRKDLPQPKAHTHEITALDSETLARVVWAVEYVLGITSAEPEDTFTKRLPESP